MALAHSYSAVKAFETCARQYHQVRILKKFKQGETEAMLYGTAVHAALEEFLMKGTPLPAQFSQFQPFADSVNKAKGIRLCEVKMGIRADFSPCGFYDKDVWFRGMPDVLFIDGELARVGDWKTGKSSRYADPDQLELMAAMTMAHYPEVQRVKGALIFLVAKDTIKADYTRSQFAAIMSKWAGRASRIESALETGTWNPRKGPLCRYCPVDTNTCEFKE